MLAQIWSRFSNTICSTGLSYYYSTTHHITSDLQNLNIHTEDYCGQDQVLVGNDKGLKIHHLDKSIIFSAFKSFFLNQVLHVPHIKKNLLSVYQFTKDNDVYFEFHPSFFCVKDRSSGAIILQGQSDQGLYPLHNLHKPSSCLAAFFTSRIPVQ